MELLSLYGLYVADNTLFDNMVLPDIIDRDDFISNLLLDTAELEVCYADADFMKSALGYWTRSRLRNWQHLIDVLESTNYEPFINLQRTENYIEKETRDLQSTSQGKTTATSQNESESDSTNQSVGSSKAWNDTNFVETSKTVNTTHGTGTDNVKSDGTSDVQGTDTGTIVREHTTDTKGDSALYSKQKIMKEEVENRMKYYIYDIILDEFKTKFCLLIY